MNNAQDFSNVHGVVRHVRAAVVDGDQITKVVVMVAEKEDHISRVVVANAVVDIAGHNKAAAISKEAVTNKAEVTVISRGFRVVSCRYSKLVTPAVMTIVITEILTVHNRMVTAKIKEATIRATITSRVAEVTSHVKVAVVAGIIKVEAATNHVRVAVDIIKVVKVAAVISLATMTIIKAVAHPVKIIEIREVMMDDIVVHLNVVTYLEAIAAEVAVVAHLKVVADMEEGITVAAEVVISHDVHLIREDSIRIVLQERTATRIMTITATNAHRKTKNRAQKNGLLLLREQAI